MQLRYLLLISLTFALLSPSVALPQNANLKPFDVKTDAGFRTYQKVVTNYALKHGPKSENHFCVLGFHTPDDAKSAWVIWQEGREIILWDGVGGLESSPRKINLRSDVVATEKDLHGSTYLVTRAWVKGITATCDASGAKVQVPGKGKAGH